MRKFLFWMALLAAPAWASGELSNRRAPGFSLMEIATLKQRDLADYRGKVVITEIMQTGCPHCGPFAEKLEELSRKYAGRVQVISIVNPPDNDVTVGRFIKAHGLSYPLVYDCGQAAASYMMATPQRSRIDIPHVFVIDPEGIIRNDFGYGVLTKGPIFEGRGLFEEVEKLLGSAAGRGEAKSSPKK